MRTKKLSWIGLITFCTASTIVAALGMALIFTSASMIYADAQSDPSTSNSTQSFSGIVTDDHCGAKHQLSDRSPADCTRICVTKGAKYVLIDGDKVYILQGDIVKLNRLAGERVTVVGSLHGQIIDFSSITAGQ